MTKLGTIQVSRRTPIFVEQFMKYLNKEIGIREDSNILHLFCGRSKIGDTCDIIPFVNPKFNIDCCSDLPFEDESYDYIIADPPYDLGIKNITDTFKPYSWIPEAIRVLKTNGYLVILDSLNYKTIPPLVKTHLVGVDTGPNLRARWLIIFKKGNEEELKKIEKEEINNERRRNKTN